MPTFAPGLVACVAGAALASAPALPLVSRVKAPSVVVWPADGSAVRSEADAAAVRDAGFEAVGFDTISAELDEARSRTRASERERLAVVRQGLDAAEAKFLAQDWDAMLAELDTLESSALALLATPDNCPTLWELQFRRGLALFSKGDKAGANARFRFAAALDENRKVSEVVYGPDVVQAFLAAAEGQRADVKQPVDLAVEPSDALVVVDCRAHEGDTVRLAPGLHVVRVDAPSHAAAAVVVDTRSEARANAVAAPDGSAAAEGLATAGVLLDRPSWATAVSKVAAAAGADAYVWLAAEGAEFAAQVVVDGKRGRRREADSRAAAVKLALEDLGDDGTIRMGKPTVVTPPTGDPNDGKPPRKRGVARKWWFWTIIGGVVVAAALGLGLGLGLRPQDPDRLRLFGPG